MTAAKRKRRARPNRRWEDIARRIERITYRVHAGGSVGTAFAIGIGGPQHDGTYTMLCSAWHVVAPAMQADADLDVFTVAGAPLSGLVSGPSTIQQVGPIECDSALIAIPTKQRLHQPDDLPDLYPVESMLPRGAAIGWMGFPGLVHPHLCFFRGTVSGHMENPPVYLIDGVAINGVSGGPAVDEHGQLVGFVTAYMPNEVRVGVTLPGLMILTPINLVRLWMQEIVGAEVWKRFR